MRFPLQYHRVVERIQGESKSIVNDNQHVSAVNNCDYTIVFRDTLS